MADFYEIDFSLTAERLLPPDKRNPIMLAWLGALMQPFQTDHDERFNVYKPDIISRTKYNGQVIVLTQVLNNMVSATTAPYVYLHSNDAGNSVFVFTFNEIEPFRPPYLYNRNSESASTQVYLYNRQEYIPSFDYTIFIPTIYSGMTTQVVATAQRYTIEGVNFDYQYY